MSILPPAWYCWLLRLFPARFHAAWGRDLERLAADMRAEQGGAPGPWFWLRLTADALGGAAAERAAAAGHGARAFFTNPGVTMRTLGTSARHACRQLARQPLYSGLIVFLVALGIAGNAAVFRLFDGLFLRALPFDESHQLVDLDVTAPAWNLDFVNVSITDFNDWRAENQSFAGMTAYTTGGGNLVGPDGAVRVDTIAATHDIDDVLRLVPVAGRFFSAEEDAPDAARVAMLAHGFWQGQFAADPAVLGRTVRFGGESWEIVGVLPPEAALVGEADLWLPLREDDESSYYLTAIGRLREGVSVEEAREELRTIHARHAVEREVNEITSPTVMRLRDRYLGEQRLGGAVLFGAVALVLLIACGNIAGLMLARGTARSAEFGVRAALGASRGRLMQQQLLESLVLATVGGLIGLGLAIWGSAAVVNVLADQFPPFIVFDLDARFVAFVAAVTVGAALLAGAVPAFGASRSSRGLVALTRSTASRATRRTMGVLVTGEVALATLLLVLSGLAVSDIRALGRTDPGYRTDGVLTFRVSPDAQSYPEPEARQAFWQRYGERLRAMPGVDDVAIATIMPLMGHSGWFFSVEGNPAESDDNVVVLRRWVEPGYFDVMQVPLRAGRTFDGFDGRGEDAGVAVVNESFVRSHLAAAANPIGQRIRVGENPWLTVIGVVADTKHYGLERDSRPGVYEPVSQSPTRLSSHVALVSSGDPADVAELARQATREVDASLPIYDVQTLRARLDAGMLARRSSSWLIALFSIVALLLATAGLYGVVSYSVAQRAREIGIRLALGAQRRRVARQVLVHGLWLAAVGLGLGLAGAGIASGAVSSLLATTGAGGPGVFGAVAGLVIGVTLLANWAPARRASRIDPMTLLRRD